MMMLEIQKEIQQISYIHFCKRYLALVKGVQREICNINQSLSITFAICVFPFDLPDTLKGTIRKMFTIFVVFFIHLFTDLRFAN